GCDAHRHRERADAPTGQPAAPAGGHIARRGACGPRRRYCGCSNEPSPAKYSDCCPDPPPSTTTATCGLPDKLKTSPYPPSPPISAFHQRPSPGAGGDTNDTAPWPTTPH